MKPIYTSVGGASSKKGGKQTGNKRGGEVYGPPSRGNYRARGGPHY